MPHPCQSYEGATVTNVSLYLFTARRSYASAILGVVILSVCLSITRVLYDKTKQCTAEILYHTKGQSL